MRIGASYQDNGAAFYRCVYPLDAMERRGHTIVPPKHNTGEPDFDTLKTCDVVLVYRRHEREMLGYLTRLRERGIGIVWDNDDDFRNLPKGGQFYKATGGLNGQRLFADTVRIGKTAHAVLTPSEPLAEIYRAAGVENVRRIENYLPHKVSRKPRRHDGVVVGWIAGMEHLGDAKKLGLAETLRELQAVHPDLHVCNVGVNFGLKERYRHEPMVPFRQLPDVMAEFDIGLAPLLDTAFNRSRSDIKIKEYAASRVPWLASPHGPYAGLSENEGGRLVDDDGWYDALDALIRDARARKRLAKAGQKWAKRQTIDTVADAYEALFTEVAERARRPALVSA